MYYLYILYNREIDKYYVGQTNNLARRLFEHNNHKSKKRYSSKQKGTWKIVYKECFQARSLAIIREREIKKHKSRNYIKELIEQSSSKILF